MWDKHTWPHPGALGTVVIPSTPRNCIVWVCGSFLPSIIQVHEVKRAFTCHLGSDKSILHLTGSSHSIITAKFQSIAPIEFITVKHNSEYKCFTRTLKTILLFICPQDMNYKKQFCDSGYGTSAFLFLTSQTTTHLWQRWNALFHIYLDSVEKSEADVTRIKDFTNVAIL